MFARMTRFSFVFALLVALGACGDDGVTPTDAGSSEMDAGGTDAGTTPTDAGFDGGTTPTDAGFDAGPPRAYGEVCMDPSQCAGGFCLGPAGGTEGTCTRECDQDIPHDCRAERPSVWRSARVVTSSAPVPRS